MFNIGGTTNRAAAEGRAGAGYGTQLGSGVFYRWKIGNFICHIVHFVEFLCDRSTKLANLAVLNTVVEAFLNHLFSLLDGDNELIGILT